MHGQNHVKSSMEGYSKNNHLFRITPYYFSGSVLKKFILIGYIDLRNLTNNTFYVVTGRRIISLKGSV